MCPSVTVSATPPRPNAATAAPAAIASTAAIPKSSSAPTITAPAALHQLLHLGVGAASQEAHDGPCRAPAGRGSAGPFPTDQQAAAKVGARFHGQVDALVVEQPGDDQIGLLAGTVAAESLDRHRRVDDRGLDLVAATDAGSDRCRVGDIAGGATGAFNVAGAQSRQQRLRGHRGRGGGGFPGSTPRRATAIVRGCGNTRSTGTLRRGTTPCDELAGAAHDDVGRGSGTSAKARAYSGINARKLRWSTGTRCSELVCRRAP